MKQRALLKRTMDKESSMSTKKNGASTASALLLALTTAASTGVWANDSILHGKVVGVTDGDTITVLDAYMVRHEIRLAAIDSPETSCHKYRPSAEDAMCVEHGQPFGKAAKKHLSDLAYGQDAEVKVLAGSSYGREIGFVYINGVDVNYEQVKSGLAWHYTHFAKTTQSDAEFNKYEQAANSAKSSKIGLWADRSPIAPWDYRHNKSSSNHFSFKF